MAAPVSDWIPRTSLSTSQSYVGFIRFFLVPNPPTSKNKHSKGPGVMSVQNLPRGRCSAGVLHWRAMGS